MAYIGKEPADAFTSFVKQDFTTSATTSYTLDHSVVNENELALFINFVRQEPTTAYTASGTSLTLTSATSATDDMYCVYLGKAIQTVNPASGSVGTAQLAGDAVTEAKIADSAIESEHLNNNIISGQTALTSEPADTDEFLVSDAGTLKRIDYSLIKGGGITVADQWRLTANTNFSSTTDLTANLERVDTSGQGTIGTAMSESSGVFTFPETGIYLVNFDLISSIASDVRYLNIHIQISTNGGSSYSIVGEGRAGGFVSEGSATNNQAHTNTLVDVTNTSNVKVKFQAIISNTASNSIYGSTSFNYTTMTFIRLGDT